MTYKFSIGTNVFVNSSFLYYHKILSRYSHPSRFFRILKRENIFGRRRYKVGLFNEEGNEHLIDENPFFIWIEEDALYSKIEESGTSVYLTHHGIGCLKVRYRSLRNLSMNIPELKFTIASHTRNKILIKCFHEGALHIYNVETDWIRFIKDLTILQVDTKTTETVSNSENILEDSVVTDNYLLDMERTNYNSGEDIMAAVRRLCDDN